MSIALYPHQSKAVEELGDGKILWGMVGTGKTLTALAYYYTKVCGGRLDEGGWMTNPIDLIVITTARKRDSLDWEGDAAKLGISTDRDFSIDGVTITVDSWNNINKYKDYTHAFFIFDEQRLVGSGAWSKAFIKIAKHNRWILLTATPGDTWMDYIPVFIANGFVKNRTEFKRNHVIYNTFSKFPKVERYIGVGQLIKWRNSILVEMPFVKHTRQITHILDVDHDVEMMNKVVQKRWNPFEERPLKDAAEMFACMRKVAYSDASRLETVRELMGDHMKLIIFYNFNYELEKLRELADEVPLAEWNGHKHEPLPSTNRWVYLVQYVAGSEAWNCVETDSVVFYSLTYSYKNYEQAKGRIDRLDTPYDDLHYYVLLSKSAIDRAVMRALREKRDFNEKNFSS